MAAGARVSSVARSSSTVHHRAPTRPGSGSGARSGAPLAVGPGEEPPLRLLEPHTRERERHPAVPHPRARVEVDAELLAELAAGGLAVVLAGLEAAAGSGPDPPVGRGAVDHEQDPIVGVDQQRPSGLPSERVVARADVRRFRRQTGVGRDRTRRHDRRLVDQDQPAVAVDERQDAVLVAEQPRDDVGGLSVAARPVHELADRHPLPDVLGRDAVDRPCPQPTSVAHRCAPSPVATAAANRSGTP